MEDPPPSSFTRLLSDLFFSGCCWRLESCGPSYRLPEWPHHMVADFPHCFCCKLFITKQPQEQHKCVNTKRWGSLGTELEAILEAGNYTGLRIFLFPLQRPGKEWCLQVTMRLATVKKFLTFRVGRSWMTTGVGEKGIIGMMYQPRTPVGRWNNEHRYRLTGSMHCRSCWGILWRTWPLHVSSCQRLQDPLHQRSRHPSGALFEQFISVAELN